MTADTPLQKGDMVRIIGGLVHRDEVLPVVDIYTSTSGIMEIAVQRGITRSSSSPSTQRK